MNVAELVKEEEHNAADDDDTYQPAFGKPKMTKKEELDFVAGKIMKIIYFRHVFINLFMQQYIDRLMNQSQLQEQKPFGFYL